MPNSAFTHDPSFTIPGSTTDNAVIRWDGTSGAGQQNSGILIDDSNVLSGITSLTVDNLNLNGNSIISTDTNGNITFAPNGSGSVVVDTVGNSEMSFNGTVLDIKNNGTQSSIKLYCETGNAHYQEIRGGPHSGATSYTMVLPHVPPTANQVLTTASISSNVAVLDWADAASGGVDTTGTPANNQIATFTDTDTLQGESTLTYVSGQLTLNYDSGAAIFHLDGSNGQSLVKYKNAGTAKWDVGIDPDGSGNQKSHVDDWCMYNGGTYGVVISGNGSNQFGIGTQAGIALSGAEIPNDGIQFPATQNAISSPNNLDDYEEGTWTPSMSDGTNTASGQIVGGFYTKIGRMVHVMAYVKITNLGSVSGDLRVNGLPYPISANGNLLPLSVTNALDMAITAGQVIVGATQVSTSYFKIRLWDATVGDTPMQASEWSGDGQCTFGGWYLAAT